MEKPESWFGSGLIRFCLKGSSGTNASAYLVSKALENKLECLSMTFVILVQYFLKTLRVGPRPYPQILDKAERLVR